MHILFGPEHDGLHIDPLHPGAYEWWYFDAISDDERYVLVVIFFLGTPMSPYYKAVVDGKKPLPKDWCGVFVSLHEKTNRGYKERAYAYNLYRDEPGDQNWFRDASLRIQLEKSSLHGSYSHNGRRFTHSWTIKLEERGLWFGTTKAELSFNTDTLLKAPSLGEDDGHTWVCAAPQCRVEGTITLPDNKTVAFRGKGYHDHNFGQLPWANVKKWYWSRTHFPDNKTAVQYVTEYEGASEGEAYALLFEKGLLSDPQVNAVYSIETDNRQSTVITHHGPEKEQSIQTMFLPAQHLMHSPFYLRACIPSQLSPLISEGNGIGEVFEPARLCGPILSRALWTRIRRRS